MTCFVHYSPSEIRTPILTVKYWLIFLEHLQCAKHCAKVDDICIDECLYLENTEAWTGKGTCLEVDSYQDSTLDV